jgi:DNA polymerase-3 subunit delta'
MPNIIGHPRAMALLRRAALSGAPSHAYLFLGPAHTGKTTLALWFAQALNCEADVRPCGVCRQCTRIFADTHPDVEIITAGDVINPQAKLIRIDRLRDLIRTAALLPFDGAYKVLVVDADAVQTVQASALLKTLEEPGKHVVFVLIAVIKHALPDAIASRCQPLHLGLVPTADLAHALISDFGAEPQLAEEVALLADGRPGRAIAFLRQPSLLQDESDAIHSLLEAWKGKLFDRLRLAAAPDTLKHPQDVLETWGLWWRDALSVSLGQEARVAHRRRLDDVRQFAAHTTPQELARGIRAIMHTSLLLQGNVNPRLAMEALVLEL